jgi:hypothetical protein
MLDRLDKVSYERVKALGEIERDKLRVARTYNKRIKEKLCQVGDHVWKMILSIGSRSNKFGKWSPNLGFINSRSSVLFSTARKTYPFAF